MSIAAPITNKCILNATIASTSIRGDDDGNPNTAHAEVRDQRSLRYPNKIQVDL